MPTRSSEQWSDYITRIELSSFLIGGPVYHFNPSDTSNDDYYR